MKKEEYMGALGAALEGFDEELVQEIVADYEERFRIGAEQGKTEEDIVKELGSIKDLVEELREMQRESGQSSHKAQNSQTEQNTENHTAGGQNTEWHTEDGKRFSSQSSFSGSFDDMLRSLGKVVDMAMKETGKALELAAEQIEIHIDEAKRNRNYNNYSYNTYEESERESGEEPNVEQSGQSETACSRIVLEADIANVRIRPTKEVLPRAVCHYYSHKTAMVYPFYSYQDGDTFYVGIRQKQDQEHKSGYFRFSMSPSVDIDLLVPEGVQILEVDSTCGDQELYEVSTCKVKLSSRSGDITAGRLQSAECYMEAMSGDLTLEKSDVERAQLTTKSGDCTLDNLNVNTVAVHTASGDLEARGVRVNQIQLNTMSGDLDANDIQASNMSVGTASGDIDVRDCSGERMTAASASGDVEVRADFGYFECRSQSGDVHLESRHDADIYAQSTSGDVMVELVETQQTYQISLHSVSGDCTTSGQRRESDGSLGSRRVEGKSISGDVTVRFL